MNKERSLWRWVAALALLAAVISLSAIFALAESADGEEGVRLWDFTGGDASALEGLTVIGENKDEYSLEADGLHFGVNTGDISGVREDVQNLFLAETSGSYTLEAEIRLDAPWSSPNQACLVVFDGYGDFVKLGFQGNTVALCYAKDTVRTDGFAQATLPSSTTELWLRLEKDGNSYSASYSGDGKSFLKIGSCSVELNADRAGFFVGWNGYNGTEPTDVTFDHFSITPKNEEVLPLDKTLVPNKETVKLSHGESFDITVSSSKDDAEVGDLSYSSSNPAVVTVDKNGRLTAVGDGYATVTVKSSLSGKCEVVVSALPELREYESAANPYMPVWEYIPDAEPYVFEDPDKPGSYRVYVYGSHDTQGEVIPCGFDQVVWSAPVEDLTKWRYDGVAFITGDYDETANLYAPDVCEKLNADGTRTYYLYPNATSSKQHYRVAASDRPDGPFKLLEWSSDDPVDNDILRSDPAVFIDDDGRAYGYWGSSSKPLWVELDPETMATVKGGCTPKYNLPGVYDILDRNNNMQPRSDYDPTLYNIVQDEHVADWRFFEASSIRKVGNKYVFIFCRYAPDTEPTGGYFSQLAYGYSDSPEGPWTYGGVIVRNAGEAIPNGDGSYADTYQRQNTHGSICKIGDDWYVFYHRGHRGIISRQAMVERISVEWDERPVSEGGEVRIGFAEMTSKGFHTEGLDPYKTYSAGIASYLTGNYEFKPNYSRDAEFLPVLDIRNGVVYGIKYFNFSKNAPEGHYSTLSINLTPKGVVGSVDVYLRPLSAKGTPTVTENGKIISVGEGSYKIGSFTIDASMSRTPTTLTAKMPEVDKIDGEWGLFLVFNTPSSYAMCDLNTVGFGVDAEKHTEKYTDNGNGTHDASCSLCGKELSLSELHSFKDGACVCGATEAEGIGALLGYGVSLHGGVKLHLYMLLPEECLGDEGAYMEFTVGERSVRQPISEARQTEASGKPCHKFTLSLGYRELADTVSAKFVCADGESREYRYSVKEYCGYIMKNKAQSAEYASAAGLCEALLNYGAYTQLYYGHLKADPANSECRNKDVSSVTAKSLEKYRIEDAQGGRLVSPVGSGFDPNTLTLKLYFEATSSKALTFTVGGKPLPAGTKDGYLYIEISGFTLGTLDGEFVIEVTDGEAEEEIRYSPATYMHFGLSSNHEVFTEDLKNALRALYLLNAAAKNYR